ncbi:beta-glycosyltransferase/ family 2 [Synechococcus sp. A18-25c]|uniref:glycosyltransferase n=1 Tax=Synechococcus sp. A18-25c TaxID=1866938 RepID=UPI001647B381|nr:glycosyltransferase [Synechococcus sp. A18-25c]QNJ18455.1 beta-glycosyltransferase/ family 2 [Synechococcus sp. A18-25c]
MSRPPLLLVVGMHRSGTSLLGGILQRLGVELPGETIAGDQHNPEGYFEWDAVVALQERLLIDLQRWWPAREGTLALPEGWLQHSVTRQAYGQLRALVLGAVDHQQGLWAVKDPRCSRLLPLWLELCRELDIPLRLLLAVRDPAEVVTSLVRRDGPLVGMEPLRAQQLWWRHNLEVVDIAQQADLPCAVVDFDRWFQAPEQQLESLELALPELRPSLHQRRQALALINPQHRRSLGSRQAPKLQTSVRRLHHRLLRQPLPRRWPALQPPFGLPAAVLPCQPEAWPDWLAAHRSFPAPRLTESVSLARECQLSVCGPSWLELRPHLLLQHLPLPDLGQGRVDFERSGLHQLQFVLHADQSDQPPQSPVTVQRLTLNLELPPAERASHWLAHLQAQQLILDPEPARVLMLRVLGLPVWWLDPDAGINGWLQQPQAVDPHQWAARLGMTPPPKGQLQVLGSAGAGFERALTQDMAVLVEAGAVPGEPAIAYWPGWPELVIGDPAAGLLRAGWLQAAAQRAARLVHAGADHCPDEWTLLQPARLCLAHPLDATPAELKARHAGLPLMALAEDRPMPLLQTLRQWKASDLAQRPPLAAVVVSLYNYADRITEALESVKAQTQQRLELIVVDDASTDDGTAVVERWIDACLSTGSAPFVRLLLLRHGHNAGLATARNTALAHSQAPWCFVLDADNALFPDAVAGCLALTDAAAPQLAVVHPLLAVEAEPGRPDEQRSLVRPQSWQRERLRFENHVDAMALVRRSAWEAVGGYTHIEGGWEDYDFWCKLAEAGFYGLQCPRILAVYRSHAESMSHRATNRSWHALSRTLQQRHPWLQLPLALSEGV